MASGSFDLTAEDEPEIEHLMTRGYTREQAVSFFLARKRTEIARQKEEAQSLAAAREAIANELNAMKVSSLFFQLPLLKFN